MNKFVKNKKILLYIFLFLSMFSVYLSFFPPDDKLEEVPYTEFVKMMEEGEVTEVILSGTASKLTFSTIKEKSFRTDNPKVTGFKERLLLANVKVQEVAPSNTAAYFSGTMSLLLIGVLLYSVVSVRGSGKHKEISLENGNIPTVKFEDIIANEDFIKEIQQFVDFLKNPDKYHKMGAKMPKGLIFYGPPGTGKTLTARAIAGEAGVPFFSVSGSDFVEMYVGVGAMRVRKLFKEARKKKNCIIFIDELDAVGGQRNQDANSENRQTINALLAEMDGFNTSEGILVIGATNKFEDLDSALVRAGRFDRHIAVPLPETKKERKELLKLYSKNIKLADDINLDVLSKETIGFSPATIASLVNDAVLVSLSDEDEVVRQKHFEKAMFRRLTNGHEKTNQGKLSAEEIETIAYHEAGHALVSKLLTKQTVSKVTIMGSTSGVGGATFILPEKMGLHSEEELISEIMTLYGGRAAEEVLRGNKLKITSGASNDLERISHLIKTMYYQYGMMGVITNQEILGASSKEDIERINAYAKETYEKTVSLIRENKAKLHAIAKVLIEKETIYEAELDEILREDR